MLETFLILNNKFCAKVLKVVFIISFFKIDNHLLKSPCVRASFLVKLTD